MHRERRPCMRDGRRGLAEISENRGDTPLIRTLLERQPYHRVKTVGTAQQLKTVPWISSLRFQIGQYFQCGCNLLLRAFCSCEGQSGIGARDCALQVTDLAKSRRELAESVRFAGGVFDSGVMFPGFGKQWQRSRGIAEPDLEHRKVGECVAMQTLVLEVATRSYGVVESGTRGLEVAELDFNQWNVARG